jgi:hypothetical protein
MITHEDVTHLTDETLWDKFVPVYYRDGYSNAGAVLAAEVARREFMAHRANGRTADRLKRLTFWLVVVGALQALATAWPRLAPWVTQVLRTIAAHFGARSL